MIKFEYPLAFLLIFVFLACLKYCKERSESLIFPHIVLFLKKSKPSILLKLLKFIIILLVVTALASPVIENQIKEEKKEGFAISLVLDASRSMAPPMSLDKFKITKDIVNEFIAKRENDQIGLIIFADFAYVASPLTYDKNILKVILKNTDVGVAGERYTAIYDSLFLASKMLSKSSAKTKIVILLTDGRNNITNIPFSVSIKMLKKYHIKVYTIGIGNEYDFDKRQLIKIASITNGKFFQAKDINSLEKIYKEIDKMEKSKIKSNRYIQKSYYYEYPLFLSALLLLLYIYLINKRGIG